MTKKLHEAENNHFACDVLPGAMGVAWNQLSCAGVESQIIISRENCAAQLHLWQIERVKLQRHFH